MKDIFVFICENAEIAQRIVRDEFKEGAVTYAARYDESKRDEIAKLLDDDALILDNKG